MHPGWLQVAAVVGLVGVAGGAFGAHALEARLAPDLLAHWDTGTRYAMYHVPGILVAAALAGPGQKRTAGRLPGIAAGLFLAGVILFSGSLWGLALSGIRALGMITPLGGLSFLGGWICLALAARRLRSGQGG